MKKLEDLKISFRIKLRERLNPYLAKFRQKKIKGTDFTIISNNCWGGHVYRFFGIPYQSPTIGLYFSSGDFVKFCSNLDFYLSQELTVKDTTPPIGKLGDIEIVFLHYKTANEALQKWNRRKARMSKTNILFKYCYQNGAKIEDLQNFISLKTPNKIAFVPNKELASLDESCIYFPGSEKEGQIANDTNDFRKYVNLYDVINKIYEK